jgi:hypothetical protein
MTFPTPAAAGPMTLYHPRPDRWPQVSLKGLLVLMTVTCVLAATALPGAVRAYLAWKHPPAAPFKPANASPRVYRCAGAVGTFGVSGPSLDDMPNFDELDDEEMGADGEVEEYESVQSSDGKWHWHRVATTAAEAAPAVPAFPEQRPIVRHPNDNPFGE